jgi:hypothetical protein
MARKSTGKITSAGTPINVGVDKDSSVSVRRIENGYLVSESGHRGKGKNKEWYTKEYYSRTNPLKITGGNSNGNMKFGKR